MNNFSDKFTKFVNIALKLLLIPIIVGPLTWFATNLWSFSTIDIFFIIGTILISIVLYYSQKKRIKPIYIIVAMVLLAAGLRAVWAFGINSVPTSDIKVIWDCGDMFLNGDTSMFKGTGYIARFTHFTIPVLYSAFLQNIFDDPFMVAKVINILLSSTSVIIIYYLIKDLFNSEKKAQWAAFITAIYPPLVVYSATYFTEVLAIPFYLLSLLIFMKVMKGKINKWWLIGAGISLSIGNLFRMLAIVMLVAYILYIVLYSNTVKKKIQNVLIVSVAFAIPLLAIDYCLIKNNITEYHLWSGRDPIWASILKGTNIDAGGMWNQEDAELPTKYDYDTDKVSEASKEVIIERFKETPITEWITFFTQKYTMQWRAGDFAGVYWSELGSDPNDNKFILGQRGQFYMELVYFMLVVLTYIGLYNKKRIYKEKESNLIYFIYCGYALALLITESQARYSFIVCWLFIILSFNGLETLEGLDIKNKFMKK